MGLFTLIRYYFGYPVEGPVFFSVRPFMTANDTAIIYHFVELIGNQFLLLLFDQEALSPRCLPRMLAERENGL